MGLKAVATLVPGGGAPVGGSGTPGTLAKFTGTGTSIGNSLLSESGTTITSAATAETFGSAQTWTLPSNAAALTLGGVLTLNTSQKRLGINCAPGTLLSVSDGIVSAPSYDGIRLGNAGEALFSSSDGTRTFRAGVTGSAVYVGSTTSHDLLLQRGNVTALTLGAAGAVTFAGNLTSSAAQTWTLAAGTSALNIQSGLLNLDTTNSRVGIGTASPIGTLEVRAANPTIICSNSSVRYGYSVWNDVASEFRTGTGGAHAFTLLTSNTERMRIDATGNVAIGRTTTAGTIFETQGDIVSFRDAASNVRVRFEAANSLLNVGLGTTGWGIKLPTAPGNTDPNTLDAYREGTRVLAAGDLSGWTYVTATQYWTLVGRTVTLHTIFTGGTSSATGGATIATPPLLTPLRIAAGAAVNSSGTALGNGVCVVASTSSTTGTVTTSSAISSSSVDKVITVTYETAGL